MKEWLRKWVGFYLRCEWLSWVRPAQYNWIDITICHIQAEYNKAAPQWELDFILIGIGFHLQVGMPWSTDNSRELKKRVDEMIEHPERSIAWHPDAAREAREVGIGVPPFTPKD